MKFFIFNPLKNQNQNQRYEVRMDFTGYEVRMDFKINGIKPIKALPGYECLNGIPRPLSWGLFVPFIRKLNDPNIQANKPCGWKKQGYLDLGFL